MKALDLAPVYEDGNYWILGVLNNLTDGEPVVQADLATLNLKVYDEKDPSAAATYSGNLTISSVIFDTLQTGLGWTGATGFNLKVLVTPAMIPRGGTVYRFEFLATGTGTPPTGGFVMPSVVRLPTLGLYQS